MQKVRRICTQQADPPIPFALYAAKDLYLAELYDMSEHLKVSVVALLMDRDASFVEEAKQLLAAPQDDPMKEDFEFDACLCELGTKLEAHITDCDHCAEKFKEDNQIGEMNADDCKTREDHVRMITEFRKRVKGRYCIDVSSAFPNLRVSNHAQMLEHIRETMRTQNEQDYVLVMDLIIEGYNGIHIMGEGGPDFAKEVIKSIYE